MDGRLTPSHITTARLSRGTYAGTHVGVRSNEVKRAPEPITITSTLVFMLSSEAVAEVEEVKKSWGIVKRMAQIAGNPKELMDEDAGLTTGKSLTEAETAQIAEKQAEFPAATEAAHADSPGGRSGGRRVRTREQRTPSRNGIACARRVHLCRWLRHCAPSSSTLLEFGCVELNERRELDVPLVCRLSGQDAAWYALS